MQHFENESQRVLHTASTTSYDMITRLGIRLKHRVWSIIQGRADDKRRTGWKGWLNLTNLLRLFWILLLLWGEVRIYKISMEKCSWTNWEDWVCESEAIIIQLSSLANMFQFC